MLILSVTISICSIVERSTSDRENNVGDLRPDRDGARGPASRALQTGEGGRLGGFGRYVKKM